MSLLDFKALKWVRAVVFESLSWHICLFDQCMYIPKNHISFSGTDNPSFWAVAHGLFMGLSSETPGVPPGIGWEIYHVGLPERQGIRYTTFLGGRGIFHVSN